MTWGGLFSVVGGLVWKRIVAILCYCLLLVGSVAKKGRIKINNCILIDKPANKR